MSWNVAPTAWRILPSKATAGASCSRNPWEVGEFLVYPSSNCSGPHIPPMEPLASSGLPSAAMDGDEETTWRATCNGCDTCEARGAYVGFEVSPNDAVLGGCLRLKQCTSGWRPWQRHCAPDLVLQERVGAIWYDVASFEPAGADQWTQYEFFQRPPSQPWPPAFPPSRPPPPPDLPPPPWPPPPTSPPHPPPSLPPLPASPLFAPSLSRWQLGLGAAAGIAGGVLAFIAALLCVVSASAAQLVSKLAFGGGKKSCCYTAEEITIWLSTRHSSKIPALHIAHGHPLTLLVSHANSEDLGDVREYWTAKSEELSVNVFAYEYSGYGLATGSPSERRICLDAVTALAHLTETLGLTPERDIVLYGKSIGSCPTLNLAINHAFRGVVLVSGLASGARTLSRRLSGCADSLAFNNLARLRKVEGMPVQLVHGTHDEVVSIEDARTMYDTCKAHHPLVPCWIDGGGHNGIENTQEYTAAVKAFLGHLLVESEPKSQAWHEKG